MPRDRNKALLFPIITLGIIFLLGGLSLLILGDDRNNPFKDMYLMPWVFLVGVVIAAPSVYLIYKKRFNFFNPLVFAAWSYFFPAFFIGGLILASGLSQPYFLTFVDDERYNLPLTLVYVALGYGGLSVGFFLSAGRKIGEKISNRLPHWNWKASELLLPGVILLTLGVINIVIAYIRGLLGFQRVEQYEAYDGILYLLTLFWMVASFLLWLSIFRSKNLNINHYLIIGILLVTSLTKSVFQGNRGSLLQIFIIVFGSFIMSGRKINFKQGVLGTVLISLAVIVGMIYGTTFRNVKETEAQVGIEQYTEYIVTALEGIADQDIGTTLEKGFSALGERLEVVSSVAVVVSNYEKLKPYEESYGLENNIQKDIITYFIPRIIWNDKPVASDARKYGDLYFKYSENSFAITPMSDLLRNFGPVGIPLGMIVLGIFIRIMYSGLVENQEFSYWRRSLYLMLLFNLTYEGFYGLIIPYLFKVGFFSMLGLLIIWFLVKKSK